VFCDAELPWDLLGSSHRVFTSVSITRNEMAPLLQYLGGLNHVGLRLDGVWSSKWYPSV
jgi:hypothetical protein